MEGEEKEEKEEKELLPRSLDGFGYDEMMSYSSNVYYYRTRLILK